MNRIYVHIPDGPPPHTVVDDGAVRCDAGDVDILCPDCGAHAATVRVSTPGRIRAWVEAERIRM